MQTYLRLAVLIAYLPVSNLRHVTQLVGSLTRWGYKFDVEILSSLKEIARFLSFGSSDMVHPCRIVDEMKINSSPCWLKI